MPVLGLCLFAGIVPGCICHWTPPDTHSEPADTTGLGLDVVYPVTTMWPGEVRRFRLPSIERLAVPVQFVARGNRSLMLSASARVYTPALAGTVSPTRAPSPSLTSALLMASVAGSSPAFAPPAVATAPRECWVHVDSLAAPGDSVALRFTITTMTKPARRQRWTWPVKVIAPLATRASAVNISAIRDERIIKHPPREEAVSVYPNPFNPRTTVRAAVTSHGTVEVMVYDARGARVRTLFNGEKDPGAFAMEWNGRADDGSTVSSGIYFVRMVTGHKSLTCKLILLK